MTGSVEGVLTAHIGSHGMLRTETRRILRHWAFAAAGLSVDRARFALRQRQGTP